MPSENDRYRCVLSKFSDRVLSVREKNSVGLHCWVL